MVLVNRTECPRSVGVAVCVSMVSAGAECKTRQPRSDVNRALDGDEQRIAGVPEEVWKEPV